MKAKYLFHLSDKNNLKVMIPRIPQSACYDEPEVSRVCFAKTIIGCFFAIPLFRNKYGVKGGARKYLYRTKNKITYSLPTAGESEGIKSFVRDAKCTGEVWVTKPVEVELICTFNTYWLAALPTAGRGLMCNNQKNDIRAIRRIFCYSTGIPVNFCKEFKRKYNISFKYYNFQSYSYLSYLCNRERAKL